MGVRSHDPSILSEVPERAGSSAGSSTTSRIPQSIRLRPGTSQPIRCATVCDATLFGMDRRDDPRRVSDRARSQGMSDVPASVAKPLTLERRRRSSTRSRSRPSAIRSPATQADRPRRLRAPDGPSSARARCRRESDARPIGEPRAERPRHRPGGDLARVPPERWDRPGPGRGRRRLSAINGVRSQSLGRDRHLDRRQEGSASTRSDATANLCRSTCVCVRGRGTASGRRRRPPCRARPRRSTRPTGACRSLRTACPPNRTRPSS